MSLRNSFQRLESLGFALGNLELIETMAPDVTEDDIVNKYLDIARNPPYNLNWDSVEAAKNSPLGLGVRKPNGEEYIKTDITKATIDYFCFGIGGAHRIHKKKRRTMKHRSKKRKHRSNKRTRHRRRH